MEPVREAMFFPRQAVQERFATGGLLVDTDGYQVDAGRRTEPGEVELHDDVVDIMHVVEGTARVVTGDATHELAEGDVLVIPNGVPHQFVDVSEPFLYFVAKVDAS
jgi:mannose-6-phosphate isomerase-like protein (cupin superfamily)